MNTQVSYCKKALVVLMAVMMVFTMMPSMAWAEGNSNASESTWLASGSFTVKGTRQTDYAVVNFDPAVKEYTADITSSATSRTFLLTPTQAAVDNSIYYQFLLDDAPVVSTRGETVAPQKFASTEEVKATKHTFDLAKVPVGTKHIVKLLVGPLQENATNLAEADCNVYTFTINRVVGINELIVQDSDGNAATLTPTFHAQEKNFATEVTGTKVKIKTTWVNPVQIYVGNNTEPASGGGTNYAWTDVELADYTAKNSDTAIIPIKAVYNSDGINSERTIQLSVKWSRPDSPTAPIITKSPEDVICDKGEKKELAVEVAPIQDGKITYQWYRLYSGSKPETVWESGKIQDATEAKYIPPTDAAQKRTWYCCEVTYTSASGETQIAYSDIIHFEVRLNYVNSPVITHQPGSVTLQGYSYVESEYKTEYRVGDKCDTIYVVLNACEDGVRYDRGMIEWYYNTENSNQNGTKINSTFYKSSDGCYGYNLNEEFAEGTYYIYCVVRYTDETNPNNYAETASETCKVVFKPIDTTDFDGSGTEVDPFLLKTQQDLLKLQERVNTDGISYAGNFFKVANDITLPTNWTPIGCTKDGTHDIKNGLNLNSFSGTIDGKINENENATITVPAGGLPLLGYVRGATVKNLNIKGERIEGAGLVNNYAGVGLEGNAVTIEKVCLKSGSQTLKSGLITSTGSTNPYAVASAKFTVTIKDCVIEKGVTIGYKGTERQIGSFADRINGMIENCESYASVKGKDYVGGILGTKDNAMGSCTVKSSKFHGTAEASASYAGGIMGGGYCNNNSSPNSIRPSIIACTVDGTVKGKECVGGILGGDQYTAQAWDAYSIIANSFKGKISGEKYVGGIIGFYDSLNKMDNIAGNYYTKNCGAKEGIGFVKYIDTNYAKPTLQTETVAFNTEKSTVNCPTVEWCSWKPAHNRTDDPLGADKEKLARAVDSIPDTAFCYELIMNGTPKTEYHIGDELDFKDVTFTAKWTDGTETHPTIGTGENDVKVTGYNKNSHSVQTVTLSCGYAQTTIQVAVKRTESTNPAENKLNVKFTLLGDSKHEEANQKGGPHGLALNKLDTWLDTKEYEVSLNATVWDLMQKVQKDNNNITFNARGSQYGTYVYSVTYNNLTLGELDNGKNSGWMYTVNGTHPEVGVASKFLNNGDTVVFHYTDDYTKEEGSEKWNTPAGGAAGEEVKDVTTSGSAGSATTKAPTDVKVSQKTNADGTKETVADVKVAAEHQDEIIKQAAEKKSAEIILEVSAANTKGADSVQMELDVKFVKNVADKTDADLTVNTENGKVTLDQETIKTVLAEAKGATITLEVTKVAKPTESQKKAAGANGHLLKLTIKSGDRVISDFNKGKVKVVAEIVSKLLNKKVAAIHIADDGKIEQLAGKVLTIGGKKYYEFTTPHFSTFALVDADELGLDVAEEPQTDVKALTAKLTPIARSAKTAKKNVKVIVSLDKQDKAIIKELKDAGYTVKYRFYRSTKKAAGYKAAVTKKTASYTNTSGKKGTKYFYKVQVRAYDENGKLVAKTALKQCKYATRTWSK